MTSAKLAPPFTFGFGAADLMTLGAGDHSAIVATNNSPAHATIEATNTGGVGAGLKGHGGPSTLVNNGGPGVLGIGGDRGPSQSPGTGIAGYGGPGGGTIAGPGVYGQGGGNGFGEGVVGAGTGGMPDLRAANGLIGLGLAFISAGSSAPADPCSVGSLHLNTTYTAANSLWVCSGEGTALGKWVAVALP